MRGRGRGAKTPNTPGEEGGGGGGERGVGGGESGKRGREGRWEGGGYNNVGVDVLHSFQGGK